MNLRSKALLVPALLAAVAGCSDPKDPPGPPAPTAEAEEVTMMTLEVKSEAFEHEARIPARHTCDGEDVSPALSWSGAPEGTVCYALVMDDPDAPVGTWVHWVAWNIAEPGLPEGIPAEAGGAGGLRQGQNSWPRAGYGGPCPPSGTHRYFFRVFALDCEFELEPTTGKAELLQAMEGHVLAKGELLGMYSRE